MDIKTLNPKSKDINIVFLLDDAIDAGGRGVDCSPTA